jgi:hypothetical protein
MFTQESRGLTPFKKTAALTVSLLIGAVAFVTVVFGGSMNRAQTDEYLCLYGGGLFESKGLKEAVAPGDSAGFTVWDTSAAVPASVRFFKIAKEGGDVGGASQPYMSKGGIMVVPEVTMKFSFNENACSWYERNGRRMEPLGFNSKTDPSNPSGWATYLADQVRPMLNQSLMEVVADRDYQSLQTNFRLDNGSTNYQDLGQAIAESFMAQQGVLGGQYFCGPQYVFDGKIDGKFDCPAVEVVVDSIKPADSRFLESQERVRLAEELKKAADADAAVQQNQANNDNSVRLNQLNNDAKFEAEQIAKNKAVELARIEADKAVATAEVELKAVEKSVADIQATIDNAKCEQLRKLGESCWLNEAAEKGGLPQVMGSAEPLVQIK